MALRGTDPESYMTEYSAVHEEKRRRHLGNERLPTYPESHITKYTSIRRKKREAPGQ